MHIVIGLIIAFIGVAIYTRSHRKTRQCRWRADHTQDKDGKFKFKCMACGAETLWATKSPPDKCFAESMRR